MLTCLLNHLSEETLKKFEEINDEIVKCDGKCVVCWQGNGNEINPAKKETPHSFKGQQLENKSVYRFVIYMGFLEKYLSYNLTLSL